MPQPRIMQIIDALMVGGAEQVLVDLANRSHHDGHFTAVCVTRGSGPKAKDLAPGIPVFDLRRAHRFDVLALWRLRRLLREHRIDVLHAHGRSTLAFLMVAKACGAVRIPILFHDHYGKIELDKTVPAWFPFAARHTLSQYVGVHSRLEEWAWTAGVSRDRACWINNALDLSRFDAAVPDDLHTRLGIASEILIGVVACGIRPEKGIDVLLDAIAKCQERRRFVIVVIGGARDAVYATTCQQRVRDEQLPVYFAGEQHHPAEWFKGADFAVLPSRSESGPLVLIEYLACGLPVVSTQTGGIAQQVAKDGVCSMVPPGDPTALAQALDGLVSLAPAARRQLGVQAREYAKRTFDLGTVMPRWYHLYERLL
ncbi:MAG: glycosyltransferase [bacterium]